MARLSSLLTTSVLSFAVAAMFAIPASAAERDTVIASCKVQLNLAPKGCECIADKAKTEFNEKQHAFFLAVITQDKAAQARWRGDLTVNELTQVGMRMGQMPGECAG